MYISEYLRYDVVMARQVWPFAGQCLLATAMIEGFTRAKVSCMLVMVLFPFVRVLEQGHAQAAWDTTSLVCFEKFYNA
jgi:hypothetical protein